MGNLLHRENESCQWLRNALDQLATRGETTVEDCLDELPGAHREHAMACVGCRELVEEFVEVRRALAPMAATLPEPGPWFLVQVMSAIASKEQEVRDGVWLSVRRLAPRLVAVSTFLLLIGGSWALEQRRYESRQAEKRTGDYVFDASASSSWTDDGISAGYEVRP